MEQIYLPRLTKINKTIIVASVSLFVLNAILGKFMNFSLTPILGVSLEAVKSGMIHQLLTYPLLGNGVFEVVLNCLMLWLMGSEFEASWGVRRYLSFLLAVVLGAAFLTLGIAALFPGPMQSFSLTGLSGVVTSLCVAYAFLYPDRLFSFMMVFPVKAKIFCLILAGISLYQGFFTLYAIGAWSQLGAMGMGFLYMYWTTKKGQGRISRSGQTEERWGKAKKSKANLSIVRDDGENNDKPKYWH